MKHNGCLKQRLTSLSVLFILILSSFLLSQCKRTPKVGGFVYASNTPTTAVYVKPYAMSSQMDSVLWGKQIEILDIIVDEKENRTYYQVSVNDKKGYVRREDTESQKPELFARVKVDSRLRLRSAPNIKSEIVDVLNNGTVAKVLEIHPKLETYEGKTGFWLKIAFSDKQGWIFSGFTILSPSEYSVNMGEELYMSIKELEFDSAWDDRLLDEYKILKKIEIGPRTIVEAILKSSDDKRDNCKEDHQLFIYTLKGEKYYKTPFYSAEISKIDFPVKNAISVNESYCGCCCPYFGTSIYYFGDKVQSLPVYNPTNSFSCNFSYGEEYRISYVDNRKLSETEFLHFERMPDCYDFFNNREDINFDSEISKDAISETKNTFYHFTFENEIRVEKKDNQGIPEVYKSKWDSLPQVHFK